MPIDTVRLVTGDTDRVSVGGGSHSGRALRLASIVMLNASRDIIAKGLRVASHALEAAVADIEFADRAGLAADRFAVSISHNSIRAVSNARSLPSS